ncbi:MAG: response regulator [Candidatus Eisenbacteria bacterium]|uniref:histidine kinase n=1 Tax=Eiseniibacteriota bacterium TaxID=2212470 RepID=A0A956RQ18_UNCEI|nr:response regulator [Candidatus Eisenbacteria bacterium]
MSAEARVLDDSPRLLVVEDDPDLRKILKAVLLREGYKVQEAGDGEEALRVIDASQPDLILLDVMMPKMDGRQVCQRLKANARTSQIPIIMLTAMSESDDRVRGLDLGANDYITKPYEQRELLMRVRNLLDWGRLQRDANPLTGLPGNQRIEAQISRRIAGGEPFVFMYLDVDHFKAYNDFYSYQKGDQVIRVLSLILRDVVEHDGSADDFVGHIGGDDFVVIVHPDHAEAVGEEILARFDREVPMLYNATDRERGYIETSNRQGGLQRYPLMTLTIAAVSNQLREITHVAQVSDIAAELKRFGKEQERSVMIWDRRGE